MSTTSCQVFEPVGKKPKLELGLDDFLQVKSEQSEEEQRPALPATPAVQLPSVQMFGSEVVYRRHGKIILFRTQSVLELVRKWLLIASDVQHILSSQQVERNAEALRSPLISWGSLRLLLQGFLLDLALADLLSHYRPFGKSQNRDGEDEICSLSGVLKLGSHGIGFSVLHGKVYLSIEDVEHVIKERGEQMISIAQILAEKNMALGEAYFKVENGFDKGRALLDYVEMSLTQSKLGGVLRHLEKQICGVKDKRDSLEREMEQTVEMINRQSITLQACTVEEAENKPEAILPLRRTYKECSNTQCGRTYHFILSCCHLDHVLKLGHHSIPYMYHNGIIYLEKCSAFDAIGKTSIIRCSNYKKVDRILLENGLDPALEFLQQETFAIGSKPRRGRRVPGSTGRNRRNHISLAALTLLVRVNFISSNNQANLLHSLEKFSCEKAEPDCQFHSDEVVEISDVEDTDTKVKEDDQSSSGVESEEDPVMDNNVPSPDSVFELSDETKPLEKSAKQLNRTVRILDIEVPYKVLSGLVFLKKTYVLKILQFKGTARKMNESLEKLIGDADFPPEKAFLYEGRLSNYVSTPAVRCILNSGVFSDPEICKDLLLNELDRIEANIEDLTTVKYLSLKTLGVIKYQLQGDVVYFDTLKLMRMADIHLSLVKNSPSKANYFVKKLLQDRGVNISSCFLKQRNSKYAFINLRCALILLQYAHESEHKERAFRLKKELLLAASAKNLLAKPGQCGAGKLIQNQLKISNDIPNLKYKIKAGMMFFHRKTVFDCIGLETVIYGTKKGFLPINTIITDLGLDFSQVYLSNQQEVFAYMSTSAILLLLESMESIMVMLPRRQNFLGHLLHAIEFSVCSLLGGQGNMIVENQKVPWISRDGRLFFDRDVVFALSRLSFLSECAQTLAQGGEADKLSTLVANKGLELDKDFARRGPDVTAYIGLHTLLVLCTQECDSTRQRDAYNLLLRDSLSAISIEEPKLRNHIRMSHFRLSLVNRVISEYLRSLQETGAALELDTEQEESGLELDNTSEDEAGAQARGGPNQQARALQTEIPEEMAPDRQPRERLESEGPGIMEKIRTDLIALSGGKVGGNIGDWELVTVDPVTHLSVRAGYGASRKLSFLQPDVAAILRYDLFLSPDMCQLSINDRRIDDSLIEKIVAKSNQEGGLSLLYQLISLRPCFGSFSPELVETVSQSLEQSVESSQFLAVDLNFIGTSSNGRTYAGTVRSTDCTYVAESRVADRCAACSTLDSLVINRSLLSGEAGVILSNSKSSREELSASRPSHQSVWRLDTTDEKGCSFLCPQVQTFNSSLPHAFVGSAQATTVVDHRVEISDHLDLKVELNGKPVSRSFPQFSKDHQLGPLLDRVASLRLCIGYPAARLVNQARFVLNQQGRMIPEMRKLFRHFHVDEGFTYRVGGEEENGTIRSDGCTVEAETSSDICAACRTMQQPLEFQ